MMKIPFLNFDSMHSPLREQMIAAFTGVYDSNWFVMGSHLKKFEIEYASYSNVLFSLGVSNGLDALFLSLKALGVEEGDEVIVPANTYIATVLAVTYVGATPVFVEPNPDTFNIDPSKIIEAITSKTKAIMPVHLYGQACEMEEIMEVAKINGLFVVEDNAQAQGAAFNEKRTGSFGDISGTSFYPGKNLGALGDSGAVTSNNEELIKQIEIYRNYGSSQKYVNDVIGYNMRMDELQAAFLSVKLKSLDSWIEQRKEIAELYLNGLGNSTLIKTPYCHPKAEHVYHLFVIQLEKRDELMEFLKIKNIGTLIHYPIPPHLQNAYAEMGFKKGDFPITEKIANTCLSLPMWPGMTGLEVEYVIESIYEFENTIT